jgi:hypothetical protein
MKRINFIDSESLWDAYNPEVFFAATNFLLKIKDRPSGRLVLGVLEGVSLASQNGR